MQAAKRRRVRSRGHLIGEIRSRTSQECVDAYAKGVGVVDYPV